MGKGKVGKKDLRDISIGDKFKVSGTDNKGKWINEIEVLNISVSMVLFEGAAELELIIDGVNTRMSASTLVSEFKKHNTVRLD